MGLETGLKLGQKFITAWTKTGVSDSILAMRKVNINISELKLASKSCIDEFTINPKSKIEKCIEKFKDISDISVIEKTPRALTGIERKAEMASPSSRDAIMYMFHPGSNFTLKNYCHPNEYIENIIKGLEGETFQIPEILSLLSNLEHLLRSNASKIHSRFITQDIVNTVRCTKYEFNARCNLIDKADTLKEIQKLANSIKPKESETPAEYIKRLYSHLKEQSSHKIDVKYSPTNLLNENKVILTEEEKKEFVELCSQESFSLSKKPTNFEEAAKVWIDRRIGDYVQTADKTGTIRMQNAALETLPRYDSRNFKENNGEISPLFRWLHFEKNIPALGARKYDERLEKYMDFDIDKILTEFKVGEIYSYTHHQSFSKSNKWAEGVFRDDNPGMNVKFVVYPKEELSKARDTGNQAVAGLEAIYPANTPFKIIDKYMERCEDTVGEIFYRWIIKMQEF